MLFQDEIDNSTVAVNLDNPVQNSVVKKYKSGKQFSDIEKAAIVSEVVTEFKWNSVKVAANNNNVKPSIVESWVNTAGYDAPTELVKSVIVKQCVDGEESPEKLAQTNNCHRSTVSKWVKKAGEVLPGHYVQNAVQTVFKCRFQKCSFQTTLSQSLDEHISCKYFFYVFWAFHVHSLLSGCGMSLFFLAS